MLGYMVSHSTFALAASLAMALIAMSNLSGRSGRTDDSARSDGVARGSAGIPVLPGRSGVQERHTAPRLSADGLIIDSLRHYSDSLYGFDVAIPTGWQRIVTIEEPQADSDALDWSYAVGFESPRNDPADRYADYVMIEVLPGTRNGTFESTGEERETTSIDGRPAIRDRVWLDSVYLQEEALGLVVYQATFSGLGYQVGLYAIGEQHEAVGLQLAFDAMLETFTLREAPYSVF